MPSEQKIIVIPDGKICDYIDGKFRNDTPEEYVRQTIEKRLVNEHKYLPEQIRIEYTLQVGSNKPRADIVIWEEGADQTQGTIKLIIECKKETVDARNAKDGIAQLKSYMSVCPNCEWGMWTNSVQKYVFRKAVDAAGNITFMEYNDIPAADGNLDEVNRPSRTSLKNAYDDNLLFVFKTCHKPTPDGYISAKTKTNIGNLRVKENQILMTCSGTIGKVSFVSRTLANKIFSHDLLRIDCRKPDEAGYIYAFLKSKIGNKILLTNSYGAVITHIEPEHLATVPIPDAPTMLKKKIHDLIVRSYELRDESNDLIDQATALLIGELKLPDIDAFDVGLYKKAAPVDTFSVRLSEMSGRLDASYHVPIVDAIIEHLKRYAEEVTTVGDPRISREVILPGRFKRVYVDEGYGRVLIGGKQLSELDPSSKKYLSTAKHDKMLKKLEVHEGTTLITRSGTIGKITIVPKHWEHYIPSDHIIRVIPANKDIAGYLNIFLASDYGKVLITRFTYGSVVDEIDDNHVRQIAIPLLKNHTVQKKINDLALEANEKRYQAYLLEQEALQIMDRDVIYAKK